MEGELFVVSGPSGVGKTTILKRVLKDLDRVAFSVSHTTRLPREGEIDGVDYHFVTRQEFEDLVQRDCFLEWARVHSDLYGTSRDAVSGLLEKGIDVIADVDVQGARSIRRHFPGPVLVFVAPPSMEELKKRLMHRKTDTQDALALRLENAGKEMQAMGEYDYIIINDALEAAVMAMEAIILAHRLRTERVLPGLSI